MGDCSLIIAMGLVFRAGGGGGGGVQSSKAVESGGGVHFSVTAKGRRGGYNL